MLIRDIIEKYTVLLSETSQTPRLDVEVVLCHILGWDRVKLMINYGHSLDPDKVDIFKKLISKRIDQMPIAYIINKKEFMGLDFYVDNRVLIPRPDTEILVEDLVESIEKISVDNQCKVDINIVDMCTGSGAIILSAASQWKEIELEVFGDYEIGAEDILLEDIGLNKIEDKAIQDQKIVFNSMMKVNFIGVDISRPALDVASLNREKLGLPDVKFLESDLFGNLSDYKGKLDIIVSNPPYIEDKIVGELQKDVKDFEPRLALCGGKDGMDFYNKIIEEAYCYLKPGGKLIFESGHNQAGRILKKMREVGYIRPYTKKDIQGFERLVAAYKY